MGSCVLRETIRKGGLLRVLLSSCINSITP